MRSTIIKILEHLEKRNSWGKNQIRSEILYILEQDFPGEYKDISIKPTATITAKPKFATKNPKLRKRGLMN